ncbi:MAG: LTA synthase family protein [Leptospiraceae bacterium]|nr:LTA synthase family protein [Leptospiraceae bacterium]
MLPLLLSFYLSIQFDSTLNQKKTINNNKLNNDNYTKVSSNPYLFDKPDVIIFLLEGVSDSYLDFPSKNSKIDKSNIQKVENCFIPIPHSSKSIFTLLTGSIQLNTTRPNLNNQLIQNSLPNFFQSLGYQTNFIFTQSFAFENIDDIANKLFQNKIDSRALEAWSKNKNLNYQTFAWGIDDTILIDYVDEYLLSTQEPIFTLIGFSNTHSPYFIPSTNPDHTKGKLNKLERYKSSIKRTETILVDLMNRFSQRRKKEPLFLILSDHGESFGERNFHNHNYSIYNQETKIPCIFIHSSFKNKLSIKSAGLMDIGFSIKNLITPNTDQSNLEKDIFSDKYSLRMPLKTWNSNTFIGLIEGDTKYILDKRRNQLFLMDLNENNPNEQTSSKEFDLFYKKWNAYSEE